MTLCDVESDLVTACVIIHNTSQGRWQNVCLPNVISLSAVLSVVQDTGDLPLVDTDTHIYSR